MGGPKDCFSVFFPTPGLEEVKKKRYYALLKKDHDEAVKKVERTIKVLSKDMRNAKASYERQSPRVQSGGLVNHVKAREEAPKSKRLAKEFARLQPLTPEELHYAKENMCFVFSNGMRHTLKDGEAAAANIAQWAGLPEMDFIWSPNHGGGLKGVAKELRATKASFDSTELSPAGIEIVNYLKKHLKGNNKLCVLVVHSRGGANAADALLAVDEEIRKRVIVINCAGAKTVPCGRMGKMQLAHKESVTYVTKEDPVPHIDRERNRLYAHARHTLPKRDASRSGHSLQTITYLPPVGRKIRSLIAERVQANRHEQIRTQARKEMF